MDDPVTPPTWGEEVAHSLANSRHLVVPGSGHISTPRGCVPKLIGEFLDQGNARNLDATCIDSQHRPPFFRELYRSDTAVIDIQSAAQEIRRGGSGSRGEFPGSRRDCHRTVGSERRGQDHGAEDALGADASRCGHDSR